jgi:hypothetical protein
MRSLMHETIIVNNPPKPSQLYRLGWNAYYDGMSLDSLATESERRGWKAANRAEAEAATAGYAESMGW